MGITVRKYTQSDEKVWDAFIHLSSNGTLFHLRSFLSYHIERKFTDHSLIFEVNKIIMAILPGAIITESNKKILHSPA